MLFSTTLRFYSGTLWLPCQSWALFSKSSFLLAPNIPLPWFGRHHVQNVDVVFVPEFLTEREREMCAVWCCCCWVRVLWAHSVGPAAFSQAPRRPPRAANKKCKVNLRSLGSARFVSRRFLRAGSTCWLVPLFFLSVFFRPENIWMDSDTVGGTSRVRDCFSPRVYYIASEFN